MRRRLDSGSRGKASGAAGRQPCPHEDSTTGTRHLAAHLKAQNLLHQLYAERLAHDVFDVVLASIEIANRHVGRVVDQLIDRAAAMIEQFTAERDAYIRPPGLPKFHGGEVGGHRVIAHGHRHGGFATKAAAVTRLRQVAGLDLPTVRFKTMSFTPCDVVTVQEQVDWADAAIS